MNQDSSKIKDVLQTQLKHILIPVSSEFYHRDVYNTAVLLAQRFGSQITLLYIIEEKTLDKADKRLDTYRTHFDIEQTKRQMIRESANKAAKLVFSEADQLFSSNGIEFSEKISRGEFSEIIKKEINDGDYDFVLMGFEKGCLLNYRLFDEISIPIWVEAGNCGETILAVCSNLAPNQKVPIMGMYLAEVLQWSLQMLYVVDLEDSVMVDSNGARSEPKTETELTMQGNAFIDQMKANGLAVHLTKGGLEKETIKEANNLNPRLVIIGREHKKKHLLNPFRKGVKRKIAEDTRHSLLFIN